MWDLVGKKIRRLRESLDESQAEFGDRFGVEQGTVSRWEVGKPVQRKHHEAIAELAGMPVAEFFFTKAEPRLIPIVGYVSGGDSFIPVDDNPAGVGIDRILLNVGSEDQVAVRVRGDSMSPAYRDGDDIIGRRLPRQNIASAIGKDCIIKTTDGEGYVKILHKGKRGRYRLVSYNLRYEPIEVAIEWVAPVVWVRRR